MILAVLQLFPVVGRRPEGIIAVTLKGKKGLDAILYGERILKALYPLVCELAQFFTHLHETAELFLAESAKEMYQLFAFSRKEGLGVRAIVFYGVLGLGWCYD
jgi:hypothetical protein